MCKMKVLLADLNSEVYWKVDYTDLTIGEMYNGKYRVLNPLLARKNFDSSDVPIRLTYHHGAWHLSTRYIPLATDFDFEDSAAMKLAFDEINGMLPAIRIASGQVGLGNDTISIRIRDLDAGQEFALPAPSPDKKALTRSYLIDWAIGKEELILASQITNGLDVPVYKQILLDAVHALHVFDYRRAVLYSAISIESMAGDQIDKAYENMLLSGDTNGRHRLRSFVLPGGQIGYKDPVFIQLLNSKQDFRQLLDVRPLYMLERSLLEEDENLYKRAVEVYGLRNKIAHKGEPDIAPSGGLAIDRDGATLSVQCAIDVFSWFGVAVEHTLPSLEFVEATWAEM